MKNYFKILLSDSGEASVKRLIMVIGIILIVVCVSVHLITKQTIQPEILTTLITVTGISTAGNIIEKFTKS